MQVQILRFNLGPDETISTGLFERLRGAVTEAGALAQYCGYSVSGRQTMPKRDHEITWIIQWEDEPKWDGALHDSFAEFIDGEVADITVETNSYNNEDLLRGLNDLFTEIVVLRFKKGIQLPESKIHEELNKSSLDLFEMPGYVGGDWGFATNTTSIEGLKSPAPLVPVQLPHEEWQLAVIIQGWESIELQEDATETKLFAKYMRKIGPHVESSGAWYVNRYKFEYENSKYL